MALSPQQEAAIQWVTTALATNTRKGMNLVARAGCGKTYTLIEIAKMLSKTLSTKDEVYFGAYNASIAKEIKGKLEAEKINSKHINASTLHSAGFSAWRYVAKNVQVDEKKVSKILNRLADELTLKAPSERDPIKADLLRRKALAVQNYGGFVLKAVSLAKQRAFGFLCSYEDMSKWYDLSDHFGLEDELAEDCPVNMDELIRLCIHVFKTSIEQDMQVIDFDDMILAPLVHNVRMWPKRVVLLDEAQDTNPARRALAIKMLNPKTGVFIAVGDDRQAIYGFTGADSDSMQLIAEHFKSDTLPLNVTYRCPKTVVAHAQQWVPDITAHESAPQGAVIHAFEAEFWYRETALNGEDAILCRNTKPLISLAYTLLRKGIACHVEGKEIGQGLIALASRWKITTLSALVTKLNDYKDREVQKWLAKEMPEKADAVEDKVGTLLILIERLTAEGKKQLSDLVDFITKLFGDDQDNRVKTLTLSTIHKSKGREWNRVFWWGANQLSPSKWAKKDWQLHQEYNLMYVAATRAKSELIIVNVAGL